MSKILLILTALLSFTALAGGDTLAVVRVAETAGLARELVYIEIPLQTGHPGIISGKTGILARSAGGAAWACQLDEMRVFAEPSAAQLRVVFPLSLAADETKTVWLIAGDAAAALTGELRLAGAGTELQIENEFYRADLTRSADSEGKNHASGQLRELLLKQGFDVRLFRGENRMHWAPNFHKPGRAYYSTVAGWDDPETCRVEKGPYRVRTIRQDRAPDHPEILLTAVYDFYAGLPWFRFYSEMEIMEDIELLLLRNDEMTMDSLFTHVAFQRPAGTIEDLPFAQRDAVLEQQPLENDAPWLCFYHQEKGYAFGSIRLDYDNHDDFGEPSPLYHPHTRISDGAGGGKYWNRRLIDEQRTYVPRGSRYIEENAYLVFRIDVADKFRGIREWAARLRQPPRVRVWEE